MNLCRLLAVLILAEPAFSNVFSHKRNCMTNDVGGVNQGAHGYDPWLGDMWGRHGDPGRKDVIFDIHCYGYRVDTGDYHDKEPGYWDFVNVVSDTSCKSTFTADRFTSYKDYLAEVMSSSTFTSDGSADSGGSAKDPLTNAGVDYGFSAKFSYSENDEYHGVKKLFEERQGEVTLAKAHCNTADLTMAANLRPKFHNNFIAGLLKIQDKLDSGATLEEQRAEMRDFIGHFGTHYSTHTNFGAMLVYEERFTQRSGDSSESENRKKCSEGSANGCLHYAGSSPYGGGNTNICGGYQEADCQGIKFDSAWGSTNGLKQISAHTIGSYPSDGLTGWTDYLAANEDRVVPIKRELALISQLFKSDWLTYTTSEDEDADFGFPRSLDAEKIAELFNYMAENYCQEVLGKQIFECQEKLRGCGLAGICDLDQYCVNNVFSAKGYTCHQCVWGSWSQWSTCHNRQSTRRRTRDSRCPASREIQSRSDQIIQRDNEQTQTTSCRDCRPRTHWGACPWLPNGGSQKRDTCLTAKDDRSGFYGRECVWCEKDCQGKHQCEVMSHAKPIENYATCAPEGCSPRIHAGACPWLPNGGSQKKGTCLTSTDNRSGFKGQKCVWCEWDCHGKHKCEVESMANRFDTSLTPKYSDCSE